MPVATDVDARPGACCVAVRSVAAVEAYGGDLLPGTNSPALVEMGEYVAVAVREAVLADPQPDAVLRYSELAPYDAEVLEACLAALRPVNGRPHPASALLKARLAVAASCRLTRLDIASQPGSSQPVNCSLA